MQLSPSTAVKEIMENSLSKSLQKKYYQKIIAGLRQSNHRVWRKAVKNVTGTNNSADMTNLANTFSEGDMHDFSNRINTILENFSDDLLPLEDYISTELMSDVVPDVFIIEPQDVLARLDKIQR